MSQLEDELLLDYRSFIGFGVMLFLILTGLGLMFHLVEDDCLEKNSTSSTPSRVVTFPDASYTPTPASTPAGISP